MKRVLQYSAPEPTLTIFLEEYEHEGIWIIRLVLSNNKERAGWKHPFKVTKDMVNAIADMIEQEPACLEDLYFKTNDHKRAMLNARLFKRRGYDVYLHKNDTYRVRKT